MAAPPLPPPINPTDPSTKHTVAPIYRPVNHGKGATNFISVRSECHDQRALPTTLLYTKVKGHFTPTYINYPDVPTTAGICAEMRRGPPVGNNHNSLFYIPRSGKLFTDLQSLIPPVQANNNSVHQDFLTSPFGVFHNMKAWVFGERVTFSDVFVQRRTTAIRTLIDQNLQNHGECN